MKQVLKVAAFLVLAIAVWLLGEWYASQGKLPPANVNDLDSYLAWKPDADRFVHLPDDRLLSLGPGVGLLPSGPSAQVFDGEGKLVDSTADLGDDPDFKARWNITYPLKIEDRASVVPPSAR
jgi:hypothetical protein